MTEEPLGVRFHPDAATRFTELGDEILRSVRSFGPITPAPTVARRAEIHPVATVTSKDIIGVAKVEERTVNMLGDETGHFWNSNGSRVGWDGEEFQAIRRLVEKFEKSSSLRGRVSHKFLLDETLKFSFSPAF
jgi:hypothetical protein